MKKYQFKIITFLIVLFFILGCSPKIYDKSKLTLSSETFNINQILFRTDGYYYMEKVYELGDDKSIEMQHGQTKTCAITPIIFYDDGYVRKGEFVFGVKPFETEEDKKQAINQSLLELEKEIEENTFHVQIENSIWDWGMYSQTKNEILIQYYYNFYGNYRLINYTGEVLNDTTIIFKVKSGYAKFPSHVKKIPDGKEEIYHFRKFRIKPDSSNYIKNNIGEFGEK